MKHYKPTSYHAGMFAEMLAVALLTFKCYRIAAKRYKTKMGEVDIIAVRGRTLIFVEVKKRASREELYESITLRQQKRIAHAAEIFLSSNRKYINHFKRFDAILIPSSFIPTHIKNAWVTDSRF